MFGEVQLSGFDPHLLLLYAAYNKRQLLLLFLVLVGCALSCSASDAPYPQYREADQENQQAYQDAQFRVVIADTGVGISTGRILLVRKNSNFCAIRFSKVYYEGTYQKPSSLAYYAEYDWFYHENGSGPFNRSTLKSGHGRLYQKATGYAHPFDWSTNNVIECGSFRLGWNRPSTVWFHFGTDQKGDQETCSLLPSGPTSPRSTQTIRA